MAQGNPIVIVDYDPQWAVWFGELQAVIAPALGDLAVAIKHVGSTAVPGLAAKPILDVDVVIDSRAVLPDAVRLLAGLGYFHQGDLGIAGREAFRRLGPDVPRDGAGGSGRAWPEHYLYVCARDSAELRRHVAFRDYLRANPAAVEAYGRLKRELAARYQWDREAYTQGKGEFIERALRVPCF